MGDNSHLSLIKNETNCHNISGLLKLYFRSLNPPIFPYEIFDHIMEASDAFAQKKDVELLVGIISQLPLENQKALKTLFIFLHNLAQYSEVNKMDYTNIAIVFAPTLLIQDPSQSSPMSAMLNSSKSTNFVVYLLENVHEVFK